jgi:HK97 family phage major capsid protein
VASASVETDNLIDLQYAVSAPYRNRGFWFMNDSTAKAIRKKKNGNDEYVWEPSFKVGTPSQLLGNPVVIDPFVDSIGSANESVAFGDFNGFMIRDVENIRIERSDDFAFSRDMIAFKAVLRTDSDLIDTNAIAVLDTD